MNANFEQFNELDIRVGTIIGAIPFDKAKKPAYQLIIDFGGEVGKLKSSAQITDLYDTNELINIQVIAVVNFPPRQIANFMSECLVLGIHNKSGVVLLRPERECINGDRIG